MNSIISASILFILTRLMGKKQISQLTFFDYIVGISIGSIAAAISVDPNVSLLNGVISMIIWALFPIIFYLISKRGIFWRRIFDGRPTILVQNGKIIEASLYREKFTINDLLEELRLKNVFNIEDVEFAILETGGQLSVLKKSDQQTVTASQMNIPTNYQGLNAILVLDGKILSENLKLLNRKDSWLINELKKYNIPSVKDVLLASYDTDGNLHIDLKNKDPKINNVLG